MTSEQQCADDVVREALKLPDHPTTADILSFGHACWLGGQIFGIHEGKDIALAVIRGETVEA